MNFFFDTSALVKLYSDEEGSDKVREMIMLPSSENYILELAIVELLSAVYRKFRNHEIPEKNLAPIHQAINLQFQNFTIIPMASDVIEESKLLIQNFGKEIGLRTLDALHIAGWLMVAESDWQFVSSDKNQLLVVNQLNWKSIAV
jgi:predicted nucleic acid-binding protein